MEALKEHQARFIVRRYAEYEHPEIIAIEFEDLYGQEITPKEVDRYNPVRDENRERVGKYVRYYFDVRKSLFHKVVGSALFKVVRLEKLRRMLEAAEATQNVNRIIMIHEQIRKESDPVLKDLIKLMKVSEGLLKPEEYIH